jgi:hypothetical protein
MSALERRLRMAKKDKELITKKLEEGNWALMTLHSPPLQ